MTTEWTRARAERSLAQMMEWIGRHDSRSAGLMAITMAMMGALSTAAPPLRQWTPLFIVIMALCAASFGFVLYQIMRGMIPRIRTSNKPSMSFFGTVAHMPQGEFVDRFVNMSEEAYLEDLLGQVYVNARILRSKFRCLKRGQVGLLIAGIPWVCALYMAKSL